MKAIIIVIDGCRVDGLEQAQTPNLDRLAASGVRAVARTVLPPITQPVHFSIFTSMSPFNHGVLTNTAGPEPSPGAMGLLELAKTAGLTTASLYNWEHLRNLSPPGALDFVVCLPGAGGNSGDERLTTVALELIRDHAPDLVFLYLGWLDAVGHDQGWMSPEYLATLERADRQVGLVWSALGSAGEGGYHLFVLSDHGGADKNHEESRPEVMSVPWIAWGPGIREGLVLEPEISILDTAPAVARLLGLPLPPQWQGRPLEEVFRD